MIKPRFSLGEVFLTAGVNGLVSEDDGFSEFVFRSLARHWVGDWGDLCEEDRKENELSLEEGFRLLSAYSEGKRKIWIITEADRSATTVLFPNEY
jgi:hypothetical protein